MKRKLISIFVVVVLLAAVVGCAGIVKNSYVTLSATKDLYGLAKGIANDLYQDGKITDKQVIEINRVADVYRQAHNTAVDALEVYKTALDSYEKVKSAENKEAVNIAKEELVANLTLVATKWAQVASLINAIQPGTVPEELPKK
jgi:hypothetical protein